ncbi:amidohydrolase family protein [Frankia gtarii]|uniref:amidohydrolase family protein n=1 Tax=Frankia gtarii TaxID=2950102 RepID=UPI0021C253A7|nr:amidohydrolase family protein [Frankia gtarii]
MSRTYKVISSDGHLEGPPDDFLPYVAPKYRELAPRRVPTPGGGDSWLIEGQPLWHTGTNLAAGAKPKRRGKSYWNEDGTRSTGAGDAVQRLREQDRDGLDAEVLFPPIFAVEALTGISDPEAYLAIVQGYNTYLAEAYCPVAPDRLIANGVIPARSIDSALAELERCAQLGLRTVTLSAFPNGSPHPKPEDDRFWEAALALGMPVSAHIYFGAPFPPTVTGQGQPGASPDAIALATRQSIERPTYTLAQAMVAGVFDRFPDLKLYFAETNASWLPIGLQQMDENYKLYEHTFVRRLQKLPSEYVRDHVYFCFIQDRAALRMIDLLPSDNLMWGTDFPHSVTSFPNSQAWLDNAFAGVDEGVRRKILLETPAAYFKLDLSATLTPTPVDAPAGV